MARITYPLMDEAPQLVGLVMAAGAVACYARGAQALSVQLLPGVLTSSQPEVPTAQPTSLILRPSFVNYVGQLVNADPLG